MPGIGVAFVRANCPHLFVATPDGIWLADRPLPAEPRTEATGQTLKNRFLGNELRGRGHGTFFRSLGAVLGFRPPMGSLIGKGNQRNYRFSAADSAAIVDWINENLEVSWVASDVGVHAAEVTLIGKHTPLLNLRDNPRALRAVTELRALCRRVATTVPPADGSR